MPDIELINWTLSPSVVALEQPALLTGTLRNVSGTTLIKYSILLGISERQFGIDSSLGTMIQLINSTPVNWKNNTTINLNLPISLNETYYGSNYASTFRDYQARGDGTRGISLLMSVGYEFKSGGSRREEFTIGTAIDYHSDLSISSFSVARATGSVEDDEGTTARTTLQISAGAADVVSTLSLKLYYTNNGTATTSDPFIDLTSDIPTLLSATGPTAYDLLADQLSTTDNWSFLLVFTDGYEPVQQSTTISRAFANVHMSGASTGGVAFGKFSAATDQNPLFECVYPTVFSGNVTVPAEGLLKRVEVRVPITVAAGSNRGTGTVSAADLQSAIGEGWTAIGLVGSGSGGYMWYTYNEALRDGAISISITRRDGQVDAAATITARADVLCLRTG